MAAYFLEFDKWYSCVKNTNITDIQCKTMFYSIQIVPWATFEFRRDIQATWLYHVNLSTVLHPSHWPGFSRFSCLSFFFAVSLRFLSHGASIKFCLMTFNYRHRFGMGKASSQPSWIISRSKFLNSVWIHGTTIATAFVTVLELNNRAHL